MNTSRHPEKGVFGSPPDLGSGHLVGSNPTFRTKKCSKCESTKPVSEFHRKGSGYNVWCKVCRKEYDKQYWKKNQERRVRQCKDLRKKTYDWFKEYKSKLSCSAKDCSENHPACLDFHHRNPEEKVDVIPNLIRMGWSIKKILTEIEKCDILCANCHRKLHWNEKNLTG